MRAESSNPYVLHPPPVPLSTGVEYAGWRASYASQRWEGGWCVTPATKLRSGLLTIRATLAESFLATDADTHRDLTAAGFAVVSFRDATPEYFAALTALRRKIEAEGLPPLGMHVVIGDRLRPQRLNFYHALRDGRARMVEIVARKPD